MRFFLVLSLLPSLVFAQVVDVSTTKNAITVKGLSPHVNFIDQDGNNYFITTNGNVIRVHSDASPLVNIPTDGNLGIELAAVTGVTATPIAGGSLTADTTYYIVVTALDGFGETAASNEVTCTTTATDRSCQVLWSISPPPASSYRIYVGVATGVYTHYVGGITSSPYTITSFPVLAGTPPEVTTAYRVRLSQSGVHYSDGTVQNTAGGAAAWSIDALNIFSAQTGRIGIGDGVVFPLQAAKMNILCGDVGDGINNGHCINLNNRGTIAAYLVNDIQTRSNLNPSNGLLYDVTKSSWIFALGNNGDRSAFYRAAPTGGAPSYQEIFAIDGPPNTGFVAFPNYNQLFFGNTTTSGSGYYLFKGIASNVAQFVAQSGSVALQLFSGASNDFTIALDLAPIETRMLYKSTLKFIDTLTTKTIAINGATGDLSVPGNVVAGDDIQTFGHVWGAAMSKVCQDSSFFIDTVSPPLTSIDVVSVSGVNLSSTNVHPFISASLNGYIDSNNANFRQFSALIIRNIVLLASSGDIRHQKSGSGTTTTPVSVSMPLIDTTHPTGVFTYTMSLDTDGDWNSSNSLSGVARLCINELP